MLLANSATCRKSDLLLQKQEVEFVRELGIRKALDRSSKIVEIKRSLKLRLPRLKMLKSCKK